MKINKKELFWLVVAGSVGYFITALLEFNWAALGILMLTATIFIAILVGKSKAFTNEILVYRAITLAAILLVIGHTLSVALDYSRKDNQHDLLMEIRATIDRGIVKSDVLKKGFYVYRAYQNGEYSSIYEATNSIFGERLTEEGVYMSDFDVDLQNIQANNDDNTEYFYSMNRESDELAFIVVCTIPPGLNSEYENYNGQKGRQEISIKISKNGVTHEILN